MKCKLPGKITMAVCYYPEHWDEELWESDLSRMLKAGISIIRIAEFAWNKFEPEEGVFTFGFFDRFMALVEKTPMKVIFCTPTATPPAWASHNYPEILNATKSGVLYRHGMRRHYNYNSAKYRQLTQSIVTKIAKHYGNHPSIIGWQIDNELNCEVSEFYSESDSSAFRMFLRGKYGSVEQLNRAWGTVFWNQDYTSWEQVHVPRTCPSDGTNPHQQLDYLRFISDSALGYAALQADILRKHLRSGVFVTTNGLFGNMDNHLLVRESLDFMTYDSYPNFGYGFDTNWYGDMRDRRCGQGLSEVRSCSPVFGIMEQQSGANGWSSRFVTPTPKPGQMTLWTMQSIAHGADLISFFRWRTCTVGTEIYWHGILDYDNSDNRRYREVIDISQKIEAIADAAGARYAASFAVVKEFDNVLDASYDVWHSRVEQVSALGWYKASQYTHTPMDYLYINESTLLDDLAKYPLLVYPHATILSPRTAKLLENYVAGGGKLVMGCRTGYKDTDGHCVMTMKPGLVSKLCGVEVTDYTFVGPDDEAVFAQWDGTKPEAAVFNDILSPKNGAEVLACFDSNYYSGMPALVHNKYGQGSAYYFGGAFGEDAARAFLHKLGIAEPYAGIISLPEECELAVREKPGAKYFFVLNYSKSDAEITLHREMTDLYSKKPASGKIKLAKYETRVYFQEV